MLAKLNGCVILIGQEDIFIYSIDHYAVDNHRLVLEVMPLYNDWIEYSAFAGTWSMSGAAYSAHCNLI